MAPAIPFRDPAARLFERGARGAAFGVRRGGIGPARDALPHGSQGRPGHRGGGGVIQIETIGQANFQQDCETGLAAYIAATISRPTAPTHRVLCPKSSFPAPEAVSQAASSPPPPPPPRGPYYPP